MCGFALSSLTLTRAMQMYYILNKNKIVLFSALFFTCLQLKIGRNISMRDRTLRQRCPNLSSGRKIPPAPSSYQIRRAFHLLDC
jgi:hypothetical protein